jgi:hypothetical protein
VALTIDLPADDDAKDIPDYADVVIAAIDRHSDVTLVVQSMGCLYCPPVCDRVAVRMIVLINAMIPAPGERPGDWWANTRQAEARREMDLRDGRDPDAEFDPFVVFLHDVPQRVLAQERLGITCDEMSGGHLLALSQPIELVDRLELYQLELERC